AVGQGALSYLGAWLDAAGWDRAVDEICTRAGLRTARLPDGLRLREDGQTRTWINYTAAALHCEDGTVPGPGVLRVPL
ncbi:MAG: beta-galactosidase, partial [Pseudomonadota bacterium]